MKNSSLAYSVSLVIGDFIALVTAFSVAYILRVSLSHVPLSAHVSSSTYLNLVISLLPVWLIIFGLLGLYNSRYYENRFSEAGRLFTGSAIGIMAVISYSYLANVKIFPARLVVLYGLLLAFLFVLVFRTLARAVRRGLFRYNVGVASVLVVGDTKMTPTIIRAINASKRTLGQQVIAVVGGRKHTLNSTVGIQLFDSFDEAVDDLKKSPPDVILQTEFYADSKQNNQLLEYAQTHHIAYKFMPGNDELFTGRLEVELLQDVPTITVHQTALIGWGRVVKRVFDLVAGFILLVPALLLMGMICLIMYLFDHGDPVFTQVRLGRYGKKVRIYKFRTYRHAYNRMTPEEGFAKLGRPELAKQYRANGDFLDDDPRVSRLGRFLRKTSLDELPQIINVLQGRMSLVGPRPLEPFEMENYSKRDLVLSVRGGLTGLAVVSGRRDLPFAERRKLDLYYVQNWNFWLDVTIILKTIRSVLMRTGAK
jgi:exopolysaccharide biosynthesis polyprenyl glycosylphosphotransferase